MEAHLPQAAAPALSPTAGGERIEALDVVRGFALIGILIMNVEFFNRPISELGSGIAASRTGLDLIVAYIAQFFVTGKFWTIFSLLFGMGFAVMLTRAERAGRSFLVPYMRRIAALAVFGALHHIFLWSGDILFSYAVAATALLIVLYGRAKWIVTAIVLCVLTGLAPNFAGMAGVPKESLPDLGAFFGFAGGLAFFGFAAWWLRGEQRVKRFNMPAVALVLLVAGAIALIAGIVLNVLPNIPREPRFVLPVLGTALLTLGLLTRKYHEPVSSRPWRLGIGVYCFSFFMMTAVGAAVYMFPNKPVTPAATAAATAPVKAGDAKKAEPAKDSPEAKAAERAKRLKERQDKIDNEVRVLTKGSYADGVAMRLANFKEHAPGEVGFATILIGMFLLGSWFVRSGIMENTRAHLPLFRKLAMYALPLGIGMGLLGSLIAIRAVPGSGGADGYQFASGLLMLGNLPASLGYVGLVIVMLHSQAFSKIRVLAPFGRMALTNYLMQSLIASIVFFNWGFGNFGISRPAQMGYVVCVVVAQVAFSHFWLSQFRFGPMEWLWRAVTYWTIPPMRRETPAAVPAAAGVH
ncbi:DUF418 domain-containing protein [Massilia endophytica]|uniref:DUF418 domain-containing protein n=1 Tax=Massilia endophytica TaxID=2899220 RepID=UPI001E2C47DD|nr:DUF418 domain-containing protein [Massilia endophytica]UGQ46977.1 DUF418 domain-containing protein [Massilia endophytica]